MSKRGKPSGRGAKPTGPRASADRVRSGWDGPDGGRVRLIRPDELGQAEELMHMAGVHMDPYLERSIRDRSVGDVLLTGLDKSKEVYYEAAMRACSKPQMVEGLASLSLLLVAENAGGQVVGLAAAMPPTSVMKNAHEAGYTPQQTLVVALVVAKLQALAVAEHARGSGWAAALLKRTWQIYQQLGFHLLYGQFDVGSGLERYYPAHGFAVLAPGEKLSLDRINYPFAIGPDGREQLFARWRPRG